MALGDKKVEVPKVQLRDYWNVRDILSGTTGHVRTSGVSWVMFRNAGSQAIYEHLSDWRATDGQTRDVTEGEGCVGSVPLRRGPSSCLPTGRIPFVKRRCLWSPVVSRCGTHSSVSFQLTGFRRYSIDEGELGEMVGFPNLIG